AVAGVVDQHVDAAAAAAGVDFGAGGGDRRLVGDVEGDAVDAAPALLLERGERLAAAARRVDLVAARGQVERGDPPDAGGRAGDQDPRHGASSGRASARAWHAAGRHAGERSRAAQARRAGADAAPGTRPGALANAGAAADPRALGEPAAVT